MLFSRLKVWLRCVFLQWDSQPSKNKDHMCSFCWYLLAVSWWQTTPCWSRQTYVVPTQSCSGSTSWDFFTCWGNTQEKGIWTKTRGKRVSEHFFQWKWHISGRHKYEVTRYRWGWCLHLAVFWVEDQTAAYWWHLSISSQLSFLLLKVWWRKFIRFSMKNA